MQSLKSFSVVVLAYVWSWHEQHSCILCFSETLCPLHSLATCWASAKTLKKEKWPQVAPGDVQVEYQEKILHCRVLEPLHQCPGQWWHPHPWECSRKEQMCRFVIWFSGHGGGG